MEPLGAIPGICSFSSNSSITIRLPSHHCQPDLTVLFHQLSRTGLLLPWLPTTSPKQTICQGPIQQPGRRLERGRPRTSKGQRALAQQAMTILGFTITTTTWNSWHLQATQLSRWGGQGAVFNRMEGVMKGPNQPLPWQWSGANELARQDLLGGNIFVNFIK